MNNAPHATALRHAIASALVPQGEPARAGVWIEKLFAECAHADFESYSDFVFECVEMQRQGLLTMWPSAIRAALMRSGKIKNAIDCRSVSPTVELVKLMRGQS